MATIQRLQQRRSTCLTYAIVASRHACAPPMLVVAMLMRPATLQVRTLNAVDFGKEHGNACVIPCRRKLKRVLNVIFAPARSHVTSIQSFHRNLEAFAFLAQHIGSRYHAIFHHYHGCRLRMPAELALILAERQTCLNHVNAYHPTQYMHTSRHKRRLSNKFAMSLPGEFFSTMKHEMPLASLPPVRAIIT